MRQIRLIPVFLLAGASFASADLLVNTRLQQQAYVAKDSAFQIDLRDYFQHYAEPGPVATFQLLMPVQAGWMAINFDNGSLTDVTDQTPVDAFFMTYELASGGTYENVYDVYTEDLKWMETSVRFQLFPSEAPVTVANFMTYAAEGAYTDTIVHRNEPSLGILQAGGFQLDPSGQYYFTYTETQSPIPLEITRNNSAGTLAMARQSAPNTATSQFYVNLNDNSNTLFQNYCVFGELIDMESDLPVISQMGDAYVYNLAQYLGGTFSTTPMYTPHYNDRDSYLRFPSITVSAGNPDGVTYAWEWLDMDGEEGFSEEELADQALFSIQIDGSGLNISRTGGTGVSAITVTGTSSSGSSGIEITLVAYNEAALEKFPSSSIHEEGWISNSWYGWLIADDYPFIRHYNHGHQYVSDAGTSQEQPVSIHVRLFPGQLGLVPERQWQRRRSRPLLLRFQTGRLVHRRAN